MAKEEVKELTKRLRARRKNGLLANLHEADLRGANLRQANLAGANLRGADLRAADLIEADLRAVDLTGAKLSGADLRQANLRGADMVGAKLDGAKLALANLRGANLREADLRKAHLGWAKLLQVDLAGADLTDADLTGTGLSGSFLHGTNFSGANLSTARLDATFAMGAHFERAYLDRTYMYNANLTGAHFEGANMYGVNLENANLLHATFSGASLYLCHFTSASLSDMTLESNMLESMAGATVDWRTVARSLCRDDLLGFLIRTGMPEVAAIYLIESLRSIDAADLFTMLQSVFLSYGSPDRAFAERLRNELSENGVKTWFFPKDAVPGARLHRHIQTQIEKYDRMILCCSEASLQHGGVLYEIEEVLEREQSEGGSEVMIPILLTDVFGTDGKPPSWWPENKKHIYLALSRRVAADFRGALDNADIWAEQLGRLLVALRRVRPDPAT